MRFGLGILCLLAPFLLGAQGLISGFMPGAGNLDLAATYGYDSYDTYLFGDERQNQDITTQSASLFMEYGTSDRFSLLLNVPYLVVPEKALFRPFGVVKRMR